MNKQLKLLPDSIKQYLETAGEPHDHFFVMTQIKSWHEAGNMESILNSLNYNYAFIILQPPKDIAFIIEILYHELFVNAFRKDEDGKELGSKDS